MQLVGLSSCWVDYGILIANPPYGDRMLTEDQSTNLHADMGKFDSQNANLE